MTQIDRRDCERAILAACLIDHAIVPQVAAALVPEDFGITKHRRLFEAISAAEKIDLPTVADAAGWEIVEAADLLDAYVTAAAWKFYVRKLQDSRRRHSILGIATHAAAAAKDTTTEPREIAKRAVDELLSTLNDGLESKSMRGAELVYPVLEEIDRRTSPEFDAGAVFGLEDLDLLVGGMGRGDLVLIAARPSVGKTALGLQLALRAARDGRRVGFMSLEMGHFPIVCRLLAQVAPRLSVYRILHGRIASAEVERIQAAGAEIGGLPLFVMDASVASVADIRAEVVRSRPDLLVIDYLQLIAPEEADSRNEEVSKISRGLKRIALEFSIPVVALSQLKRPDTPRQPRLTDLRDSGSLEQDADIVVMLHDDPTRPKERQAIVAKHRNGPTGQVTLYWDGERCAFGNSARPVDSR